MITRTYKINTLLLVSATLTKLEYILIYLHTSTWSYDQKYKGVFKNGGLRQIITAVAAYFQSAFFLWMTELYGFLR